MHPHILSYLGLCSTEGDQIHNGATLHIVNPILSILYLLMPWWLKEPWHQQTWYWPNNTEYFLSSFIGSDNGLSPGQRQAIFWTNAGILLIEPLGTNFSEIWIKIYTFSLEKMHLKMSSTKWRPSCLGLNVLSSSSMTYPVCGSIVCACIKRIQLHHHVSRPATIGQA